MCRQYHSKGAYWQKPFLKGQVLDKHWNTFIGSESGVYNCKCSHQNLSIWICITEKLCLSICVCVYARGKGQGMDWKHPGLVAQHSDSDIFWHRRYTVSWRASFFCTTPVSEMQFLARGPPLPPSGSRTPSAACSGPHIRHRAPSAFLWDSQTAESQERWRPRALGSAGVRWEQSTLSRTALVGECQGTGLAPPALLPAASAHVDWGNTFNLVCQSARAPAMTFINVQEVLSDRVICKSSSWWRSLGSDSFLLWRGLLGCQQPNSFVFVRKQKNTTMIQQVM